MRVLIDMNLTPRWVGYLTQAGHEAIHWSTAGPVLAKDREICEYCRRRGYALQRMTLIFLRFLHIRAKRRRVLFSCGVNHSCRKSRGAALLRAMEVCQEEITRGAIVTLDWSDRLRARVLPLR